MGSISVIKAVLWVMSMALVSVIFATDPDMLQDLCVADHASGVQINGYSSKKMANVTADDFFFAGLAQPGPTNSTMGSMVTGANAEKIPGLNTLGVSMARRLRRSNLGLHPKTHHDMLCN